MPSYAKVYLRVYLKGNYMEEYCLAHAVQKMILNEPIIFEIRIYKEFSPYSCPDCITEIQQRDPY